MENPVFHNISCGRTSTVFPSFPFEIRYTRHPFALQMFFFQCANHSGTILLCDYSLIVLITLHHPESLTDDIHLRSFLHLSIFLSLNQRGNARRQALGYYNSCTSA